MSKSLADFLSLQFEEVAPLAFYRDLFPEGSLDTKGSFTKGKYTGVVIQVDAENNVRRHSITDDLESVSKAVREDDFCLISPVSFVGRRQDRSAAADLYSITFDLDGIIWKDGRPQGLKELLYQFDKERIPRCTYLVASGTGLHLYYLLEKPLHLYADVYEAVRNYRSALTPYIWSDFVTNLSREVQFESVIQSFRAVGSLTKDQETRVRAFKIGKKCSIEYLNSFMAKDCQLPEKRQRLSLERAKDLYPSWYERRIVEGKPAAGRGSWFTNRAFYDWFKQRIIDGEIEDVIARQKHGAGSYQGKRYYSLVCLSSIAIKCGISRQELEKDALELVPILDSRTIDENNHFTKEDAMKALEAYNERMIKFPRASIVEFSGLRIEPNKRRDPPLTRQQNIAIVNAGNVVRRQVGIRLGGKECKKEEVLAFAAEHPEMSQRKIALALGISKTTVNRWLKGRSAETDQED